MPEPLPDPATETALQTIRGLMDGVTSTADEHAIHELLGSLPTPVLNTMLLNIDINALFGDLDNRWVGPDYQEEVIDLLLEDRRSDISPENLAGIVHALQQGFTSSPDERRVRDVILGLHGQDLIVFKNLLNTKGNYQDLEKLVFSDIDDDTCRRDILAHIRQESASCPSNELKIFCDIDDTLQARLHETRYPNKTVYPGAIAFIRELDRGAELLPGAPGDLTFITARPMDIFGLVENYTRNALTEIGMPENTVLSGSFLSLISHDNMADKKLENFNHYRLLFPECGVVFIGDSGQGDVAVGRQMLETDAAAVRGVFIHDVKNTTEEQRARYRESGIMFFDTYIGAAIDAFEVGVISRDGLDRVVASVQEDTSAITFDSDKQRQAILPLIERDWRASP